MYKKILVPLDGSEHAETVLPYATALAKCVGAEIVLVRVITHPVFEFAMADPHIITRLIEDLRNETEDYLQTIKTDLAQQNLHVTALSAEGAVSQSILDLAAEVHADLIAMSTHGRSGPARWMLGSVAERVVRSSHIPILLIRPTGKPK